MKKAPLTALLMLTLFSFISYAQDYSTGIGIRGGVPSGITVKHFLGETSALEGVVGFRRKGIGLLGLFEMHANAFGVGGLNWFYGAGAHVGVGDYYKDSDFSLGIDGILGLEYKIEEIPISISLDYKPYFNFVGYHGDYIDEGALSLRYVF